MPPNECNTVGFGARRCQRQYDFKQLDGKANEHSQTLALASYTSLTHRMSSMHALAFHIQYSCMMCFMFLYLSCLAHVPYYVLCFMSLYVLHACTCPLCHVMSYVYVYAHVYAMLLTHTILFYTALYSLSWHHLASILSQLDPFECGFSKYID